MCVFCFTERDVKSLTKRKLNPRNSKSGPFAQFAHCISCVPFAHNRLHNLHSAQLKEHNHTFAICTICTDKIEHVLFTQSTMNRAAHVTPHTYSAAQLNTLLHSAQNHTCNLYNAALSTVITTCCTVQKKIFCTVQKLFCTVHTIKLTICTVETIKRAIRAAKNLLQNCKA